MEEDYRGFTTGHPDVRMELKVTRLVAFPLSRMLSVAHKENLKLLRISGTVAC